MAALHEYAKVSTVTDGVVTLRELTRRWQTKPEPFLVYCWDYAKEDYTIDWASDPRPVGTARLRNIILDDGCYFKATPDQKILLSNKEWVEVDKIVRWQELVPFYRVRPVPSEIRHKQYPRIFTFSDGWMHERQFVDEWRSGKKDPHLASVNKAGRCLAQGISVEKTAELCGYPGCWSMINDWICNEGFTPKELRSLGKKPDHRRVVGASFQGQHAIYQLSVEMHDNFCGESCVFKTEA